VDADRLASRLNPAVVWILGSRIHPLLSFGLMLITVTGRRSGRRYTLPVGYQRQSDRLTVLVSKAPRKSWWRNYRSPGPVEVRLRGRRRVGEARVVPGGSPEFREAIQATLRRLPWLARQLGVSRHESAEPGEDRWRAIARDTAVVRIDLASE
jgi:deazaflavin-dependent oxidoreductase (nitroreductase family)